MNKRVVIASISAAALMLGAAGPAWAQGAFADVNGSGVTSNDFFDVGDPGQVRPNNTVGSYNSASGIAQVQQNQGSANAMSIATAVQVGVNVGGPATASATVNSNVGSNTTDQTNGTRTNDVTNSFDDFSGIASVQQNTGDHNEMGIANAVQASITGATSSTATATANSAVDGNEAFQSAGTRDNDITDSFDGASGVANVQQNNGSQNAISAVNAVQATLTGSGSADAFAIVDSDVNEDNSTSQTNGSRSNDIIDSFDPFAGIVTVQQNNGDQNAIGVANAVQASIGGSGPSTSDAQVDLDVVYNTASQTNGTRDNDITRSFNGASGVATVQQNNGDQNAIGAANAIQAGIDNDGPVTSTASVLGATSENASVQLGGGRSNDITDSFNSFAGVATVQ